VQTAQFAVEVTGTAFTVTATEVAVQRGSVRILGCDGKVLVPELGAGENWNATVPTSAPPSEQTGPASLSRSAEDLLRKARRAFVEGDVPAAEGAARAALDGGATRRQAADARTLLADCAQASGQPDKAARLYRQIAERHRDLPAGETALFAAARLEANRGQRRSARALLELYLDRYPGGRFEPDARARLRALAGD
jgi:TolA-binding protein